MKNIFIFLLLILMNNCSKCEIFKDDELSLHKIPYIGDNLKMNGYFYQSINGKYFSTYFFYQNGCILAAGGLFSTKTEMDDYLIKEFVNSQSFKKYKTAWGVFIAENDVIKFERWYPGSGGGLPAYVRSGHILNDTTFVITESYRMKKGKKTEVEQRNETYHFRQFSPKPDSTNVFVP